MIKVVNPVVVKSEGSDLAYNCKCVCNVSSNNQDSGSAWTWLPWNTCGFTCAPGNTANYNANKQAATAG